MDRERFRRAKSLFQDAFALPREARASFLDDACGNDVELRGEVESLLDHAELARPEFLSGALDREPQADPEALVIPGFELGERIAIGTAGLVHRGRQITPQREVAIKLLRLDVLGDGRLERFQREGEILAALDHPAIARVYGAGVTEGPERQPWIAMEFVHGVTLDEHVRLAQPSLRRLLELGRALSDAVDHAHQRGIVHRDLKPTNVMIDEQGRLRVLDFGVARVLADDGPSARTRTRAGALLGTPAYMAPEQARGEHSAIDARADVYALGAMLYELLTGELPVPVHDIDLLEAMRRISEIEPRRLRRLRPSLSADLEAVVGKCLEKPPRLRYADAGGLARDIERLLEDRPVRARRPTALYQTRRFISRHRALVLAAAVLFALLSSSLVVTLLGLRSERRQRAHTSETLDSLADEFTRLAPQLGFGAERRPLLESLQERIRDQLLIDPANTALERARAQTLTQLAWLDQAGGEFASQGVHARAALEIRERLVAADPGDVESWTQIAELCTKLGEAARDRGDAEAEWRWSQRALDVGERLAREHPGDSDLREQLGWSLARVARLSAARGELDVAREMTARRHDDAMRLLDSGPRTWRCVFNASHSCSCSAEQLQRDGRDDEALELQLRSVDLAREALALDPRRRALTSWLAQTCYDASVLSGQLGRDKRAWMLAGDALTFAEHVVVAEPDRLAHVELLELAAAEFVTASLRLGDPHATRHDLEQATATLRRLEPLVRLHHSPIVAQRLISLSGELETHAR